MAHDDWHVHRLIFLKVIVHLSMRQTKGSRINILAYWYIRLGWFSAPCYLCKQIRHITVVIYYILMCSRLESIIGIRQSQLALVSVGFCLSSFLSCEDARTVVMRRDTSLRILSTYQKIKFSPCDIVGDFDFKTDWVISMKRIKYTCVTSSSNRWLWRTTSYWRNLCLIRQRGISDGRLQQLRNQSLLQGTERTKPMLVVASESGMVWQNAKWW